LYTDDRTTVQPFIESYFKVALSSFGEATEVGVIEMQMAIEDAGREKRWMADGGWRMEKSWRICVDRCPFPIGWLMKIEGFEESP